VKKLLRRHGIEQFEKRVNPYLRNEFDVMTRNRFILQEFGTVPQGIKERNLTVHLPGENYIDNDF
jgi:hypothetical protein